MAMETPPLEFSLACNDCTTSIYSIYTLTPLPMLIYILLHTTLMHYYMYTCTHIIIIIYSIYEPYCLQVILSVLGLSSGKHISTAVTSYFTAVNRSRSTKLIFKTLLGEYTNIVYTYIVVRTLVHQRK